MIKLTKKTKEGKVIYRIGENPTPGTWGSLQLLNNEYRKLDTTWMNTDRYKQMVFNEAFLTNTLVLFGELHCEYCGKSNLRIYHWSEEKGEDIATADHFLPVDTYPDLEQVEANLRVCCDVCNSNKGAKVWPESRIKFGYDRITRDMKLPIGDFIFGETDIKPIEALQGNFYQYADVVTLLKRFKKVFDKFE